MPAHGKELWVQRSLGVETGERGVGGKEERADSNRAVDLKGLTP